MNRDRVISYITEEPDMKDKTQSLTTQELWARLFEAPSIDNFFSDTDIYDLPSFSTYISDLAEARNEKPEAIIRRSDLDSSFGHRLFAGTRNPSRDTVIQLAFGFGLSVDEAQLLLHIARKTPLHPKVRRDAVIAFCLHNKMSLIEVQELLHDAGLPLIGGAKHG